LVCASANRAPIIAASPALQAREQQIYAGYAAALAALIADETQARPDDVAPWVAANAIIGFHKALVDDVGRQVLAGERDQARIARRLRAQAKAGRRPARARTRPAGRVMRLESA